jgi:hypothetical protein
MPPRPLRDRLQTRWELPLPAQEPLVIDPEWYNLPSPPPLYTEEPRLPMYTPPPAYGTFTRPASIPRPALEIPRQCIHCGGPDCPTFYCVNAPRSASIPRPALEIPRPCIHCGGPDCPISYCVNAPRSASIPRPALEIPRPCIHCGGPDCPIYYCYNTPRRDWLSHHSDSDSVFEAHGQQGRMWEVFECFLACCILVGIVCLVLFFIWALLWIESRFSHRN